MCALRGVGAGGRAVLSRVRRADRGGGRRGAAQGRHGRVRGRRGIDGARRAGRSGDAALGAAALVRPHGRGRRATRRHDRGLPRRRRDGRVRHPGLARGRRAARRPRGARHARGSREVGTPRGVQLQVRIGLNTGEATTGSRTDGGSFTTSDAVNVAARLEQAAPAGEILLGRDTYRLVEHAVDVETIEPLTVKGKRAAIDAFRLLGVAATAPARPQRAAAPMVNRDDEWARIVAAFERASGTRACELCAVVGSPGVGKSRLVAELAETFSTAPPWPAAGACRTARR